MTPPSSPSPTQSAEALKLVLEVKSFLAASVGARDRLLPQNLNDAAWKLGHVASLLAPTTPPEELDAERDVGRWVYSRIDKIFDAKPGTPEGAELQALVAIAGSVEEYGIDACLGERLDPGFTTPPAAERERLAQAVRLSAARFRAYERLHRAKGSIDGDMKARVNAEMAEMCEAALSPGEDQTLQAQGACPADQQPPGAQVGPASSVPTAVLGALLNACKPFLAVGAVAKGKPEACWCGQDGAVIRYGDFDRLRAAVSSIRREG